MLILGGSGKSSVGLDIGSHSVKVVELTRSGRGLKQIRRGRAYSRYCGGR
jgi:Tfp pilus assembly PilM family ATPase